MLLGSEKFVETLRPYIQDAERLNEVPRAQRLLNRPPLLALLEGRNQSSKSKRDDDIREAHLQWGYSLAEIGRFLDLHYSTVSRIVRGER